MNRRSFLAGTGAAAMLVTRSGSTFAQSTPIPSLPNLTLELTDTSLTLPESVPAGRYAMTSINSGTSQDAHTVVARLPAGFTVDQFTTVMQSSDDAGFDFSHIEGIGAPDWPRPDATVTGMVDLLPGLHTAFDPFSSRGFTFMDVTGDAPENVSPESDLEFVIGEMVINLPKGPILAGQARWHIKNVGAFTHELAVLVIPEGFTFDDLMAQFMLDETATPTPDMKVIEYLPVAAIGLLGPQRESWLDVNLASQTHYMALCMFPDDQGVPHAMNGMYAFFNIA